MATLDQQTRVTLDSDPTAEVIEFEGEFFNRSVMTDLAEVRALFEPRT